ncbi:hypothetical protein ACFPRL_17360 [Pseudoclavibacter helvolus]
MHVPEHEELHARLFPRRHSAPLRLRSSATVNGIGNRTSHRVR